MERNGNRRYYNNNSSSFVIPGLTKEEFEKENESKRFHQETHNSGTGTTYRYDENATRNKDTPTPLSLQTPSSVLCVKNLAYEATEAMIWEELRNDRVKAVRIITDKDTKRPRGFAFISFMSIVDATNVLSKYPYSSGLGPDRPLLLCGQQCILEYATSANESRIDKKIDWVCEKCNTLNSGRRLKCIQCHAMRTENCIDPERAMLEFSQSPCPSVLIRGISASTTEADIVATFSSYAPVKHAYILRDSYSSFSRGYGVIEFNTVESAMHTVTYPEPIIVKGLQVKIGYATPQCIREAHNSVPVSTPSIMPSVTMPIVSSIPMMLNYNMMMMNAEQLSGLRMIDGRPYPSNYKKHMENYVFDPPSGYFFESASQFYYCATRDMYLDSLTCSYYLMKDQQLIPYNPQSPPIIVKHEEKKEEKEEEKSSPFINMPFQSTPVINTQTSTTIHSTKPLIQIKLNASLQNIMNSESSSKQESDEKQLPSAAAPVMNLLPGQAVNVEVKTKQKKKVKADKYVEKVMAPSLMEIERITGESHHHHCPCCYICRRRFKDDLSLDNHINKSKYHKYMLKQWKKYHGEETEYRNRAEERRKTVGSTAITNPHRALYQQQQQALITSSPMVIPGFASIPTQQVQKQEQVEQQETITSPSHTPAMPSIGEMLLAKDGWLDKHKKEDDINITGNASNNRGGLGFGTDDSFLSQFVKKY